MAENLLKKKSGVRYRFFGGHDSAGRKILCVFNEFNPPDDGDIPFGCLTFTYRKADVLTHRDFLGCLMNLRLKRELIGDIIIGEGMTQIFITSHAVPLIKSEVTKIGRIGVKILDGIPFQMNAVQHFDEIAGTVASLRLDSVVGMSIRKSREKTAELIRSSAVSVNFSQVCSVSFPIECGDIFSVRGFGKYILREVSGTAKSGRIHIKVEKYK